MLRRHFIAGVASGAAVAGLPLAAHAQTKPGRWLRLESPRFIFYSSGEEQRARAEVMALERYHTVLGKLVPREQRSEMKLVVLQAANVGDLRRIYPAVADEVGGFYDSSLEQVKAVTAPFRTRERQGQVPKNFRAMDARVVLFHEYAHHFMNANITQAYPPWYAEGFAEFVSTVDFKDDSVLVGKASQNRGLWLTSGGWLPIEKFIRAQLKSDEEIARFYAKAWLAAHYLFTNPERAKGFDKYAVATGHGGDPMDLFEPSFGITPAAFDDELRRYMNKGLPVFNMTMPAEAAIDIRVERLSRAHDDLLPAMSYLRAVPLKPTCADQVAFVRSEASKYPDDPYALQSLATVELWYGTPEAARTLMDRLVALRPKDAEVQHLSGLCDLRAAYRTSDVEMFKRARLQFAEAHRLDASRAHSLYRYVECLTRLQPDFSEHMLDVSMEAYRLAPQILVIKLLAAQALMQHKRWDEAQIILRSARSNPHGGDKGSRALMLTEAAAAQNVQPLVFYAAANTMELELE